MYNLNSTMSDFLKDLSKVLNDYKVHMTINEDEKIQFASYEYDFFATCVEYSDGQFENVTLGVDLVNLRISEENANEKNRE